MPRYYYDCAIQAAYMEKNFDVKFSDISYDGEIVDESFYNLTSIAFFAHRKMGNALSLSGNIRFKKIYVSPLSERIFEPKEGDYGIHRPDNWVYTEAVVRFEKKGDKYFWCSLLPTSPESRLRTCLTYLEPVEIERRDNKPFFMPKTEESDE